MIGISAIRPLLIQAGLCDNFEIPTTNIRGNSHCGKTESVWAIYRFIGFMKKLGATFDIFSTRFSMDRVMALTNFVPLLFDEFKEEDGSDKQIQQVRDLVRRGYSGSSILRGRKDLSVMASAVQASMIVVGEAQLERYGNVAECTRTFGIDASDYDPSLEDNMKNFANVRNAPMGLLGPHFYQFVLGVDLQKFYSSFLRHKRAIQKQLQSSFGREVLRVSHNVTAIKFGCLLVDRFIKTIVPDAKQMMDELDFKEAIIDYVKESAVSSGQTIQYKEVDKETNTTNVKAMPRDELMQFLQTFSAIAQSRFKSSQFPHEKYYDIDEQRGTLFINKQIYQALYHEYCRSVGVRPHTDFSLTNIIRHLVKHGTSWIYVDFEHGQARTTRKHLLPDGTRARCWCFDLRAIREFGIWHDAPEDQSSFENSFSTKNRISGLMEGHNPIEDESDSNDKEDPNDEIKN